MKGCLASSMAAGSLPLIGNSKAVAKNPPKRIIFICSSLGFMEKNFFPKKQGDFKSSKYLKDMKTLDKMTVFENFYHPGMKTSNHDSEKSLLTSAPTPESANFKNTISIDQALARTMGVETRFPSLTLGISDRGWGQSWNETGSAIPSTYKEEVLYNQLFGKEDSQEVRKQLQKDQLVINCLKQEVSMLRKQGASSGAAKRYERNLEQLEKQIDRQRYWISQQKPAIANTLNKDQKYPFSTRIKNLLQLSKQAFQTDSTRVISLSLEFVEGAIKVPGVTAAWHGLSHKHGDANLGLIESDILDSVGQFIDDLDQIKEGQGTLLDNTTVVLTTNFGNAANHTHYNLPTIVAGGGYKHQGYFKTPEKTPLSNLYLELLHKHDIDAGQFGSSVKDMNVLKIS